MKDFNQRIYLLQFLVSDTCSKDASKDTSGPKLVEHLRTTFPNCAITNGIVKDDVNEIKSILRLWSTNLHVVFTTGGTGFASRDVTPEATKEIIEREALGLIIAMMNMGLKSTPLAMLSRAMCGISGKTLIINFPGKLKAVVECFDSIKEVIPHAVALINDDISLVQLVHSAGDSGAKSVPATKSKVIRFVCFYCTDLMHYVLFRFCRYVRIQESGNLLIK